VNTVKRILDLLEQEGIISVTSLEINDVNTPKDMRGNVVFELLSTERKYVQDLEALQVILNRSFMVRFNQLISVIKTELYARSTSTGNPFPRYNALFIW
jgi:hypothetical protein